MDELTQELVKEGEVATPSQNSMISVLIPSPSRLFSLCLSLSLSLLPSSFLSLRLFPPPPEPAILAQYEQGLKFDEDALCAAIECLTTTDVICPICQK